MVESIDRGVVNIRMEAVSNIANSGWWLASLFVATRRKKVMIGLWLIEERKVSDMKQVCSCEEGKDDRGRWGHEDICIVG